MLGGEITSGQLVFRKCLTNFLKVENDLSWGVSKQWYTQFKRLSPKLLQKFITPEIFGNFESFGKLSSLLDAYVTRGSIFKCYVSVILHIILFNTAFTYYRPFPHCDFGG